ncbi:MAG TPA: SHOCT domain-containing protein [Selenomonadales bacterium]|nr:SHOCT domain-containing protein [Selenomonadales bacterium]
MLIGMATQLAFFAVMVLGAVWLFRAVARPGQGAATPDALAILQQRYTKGEIGHDEYLRMKKELA